MHFKGPVSRAIHLKGSSEGLKRERALLQELVDQGHEVGWAVSVELFMQPSGQTTKCLVDVFMAMACPQTGHSRGVENSWRDWTVCTWHCIGKACQTG